MEFVAYLFAAVVIGGGGMYLYLVQFKGYRPKGK